MEATFLICVKFFITELLVWSLIVEQGTLLVGITHSGYRHVWYVTHLIVGIGAARTPSGVSNGRLFKNLREYSIMTSASACVHLHMPRKNIKMYHNGSINGTNVAPMESWVSAVTEQILMGKVVQTESEWQIGPISRFVQSAKNSPMWHGVVSRI